jgi:hypothetical protein
MAVMAIPEQSFMTATLAIHAALEEDPLPKLIRSLLDIVVVGSSAFF